MIFTDQPQLTQKFQGAIDRREAHIGVALLYALCNLLDAQVIVGLLDDTQDHVALWRETIPLLA
jgi:hypothetical protein